MRPLDLAHALDPAAFMAACGLPPDPWQREFLRSPSRRSLLLCSRQSGKSTVNAALATHHALFSPGALVLLLAPGQRQTIELFKKVLSFYRAVAPIDPDAESAQRLELPNRSRIIALPGNAETVRGYTPSLVIVDEAAFVPDDLYIALRPMLATQARGRFIALSTPYGTRGWFHDAWCGGGKQWTRTRITAHDCPRISPAFLEEEREALPDHQFRSEYLCEWVDADTQFFPTHLVRAAVTPDVKPLTLQLGW